VLRCGLLWRGMANYSAVLPRGDREKSWKPKHNPPKPPIERVNSDTPSPPSTISAALPSHRIYIVGHSRRPRPLGFRAPNDATTRLAAAFKCVAAPCARSVARTHGFGAVAYARRASRASLRTVNARQLGSRVRKERSGLGSAADGKSRVGD